MNFLRHFEDLCRLGSARSFTDWAYVIVAVDNDNVFRLVIEIRDQGTQILTSTILVHLNVHRALENELVRKKQEESLKRGGEEGRRRKRRDKEKKEAWEGERRGGRE